ncbi:hypothetical protein [Mucilaginibacter lappiensis]|uniref:hypothetical protein n=1 Tax=Mucilaginibacter lappiensis TaxID=354630 RepID=UPI003D1ED9D9
MTTNFFQNIASLNLAGTWNIVITTDEAGNLTVSELFNATCGDKAVKTIIPYTLKGTAEELDNGWFDMITAPVAKSAGLQSNLEAHLKSIEAAKLASKMEQDRKNKEKTQATATTTAKKTDGVELPEPKVSKEDKKKAYDDTMLQIDELIKKLKFSDALAILPVIEDYPNKENELKKKTEFLKTQINFYEKAFANYNA